MTEWGEVIELQDSTKRVLDHVEQSNKALKTKIKEDRNEKIGEVVSREIRNQQQERGSSTTFFISNNPLAKKKF